MDPIHNDPPPTTQPYIYHPPAPPLNPHLPPLLPNPLLQPPPPTDGTTRWCKHKGPCLENTIRGLLRGFLMGYGLRAALALIATLIMGKKKTFSMLTRGIFNSLFSRAPLRFGIFLAGYIGGYKGALCTLRRVRQKDDGITSAVAGAVAGSSFYALADHQANLSQDKFSSLVPYALYLFLRALEACWRRLERSGYARSIPNFSSFLFALGTGTMFYAYTLEPDSLRPSYRRFISFVYAIGAYTMLYTCSVALGTLL